MNGGTAPTRAAVSAPATGARERLRTVGPGAVVAAAFIGPGTVTTATLAGARHGYSLLWALLFSTIATIVLQEMAARLGLVTRAGLGEAVRRRFHGVARILALGLIVGAIAVGNAAYETGNLLGAALGLDAIAFPATRVWALCAAGIAGLLLLTGSYRIVERVLVAMVVVLSIAFLATALLLLPPLSVLARGLFIPRTPGGADGLLLAIGLIGTTVVPYNLFLHAAAVSEKWSGPEALPTARLDLIVAIGLGGVVSMAIIVTAAATAGGPMESALDMAAQLEPVLGGWARILVAVGLFAAGLTSAITAPLAAAYATAGAFGWPRDLRDRRLRLVWAGVLATGAGFAATGIRPISAIVFAQVANGVLLPAIAVFLLIAANDRRALGRWTNQRWMNVLGGAIVIITVAIGARMIWLSLAR
ncbi:MAG: Nramp family divalent metal transporter [Longimicrobiales bacterium]